MRILLKTLCGCKRTYKTKTKSIPDRIDVPLYETMHDMMNKNKTMRTFWLANSDGADYAVYNEIPEEN